MDHSNMDAGPNLIDFDTEEESELDQSHDDGSADSEADELTEASTQTSRFLSEKELKRETLVKAAAASKSSINDKDAALQGESQQHQSNSIIHKAREYQQELFERAKDENTIAVLDTGTGKTLIAAMLIRYVLEKEVLDIAEGSPPKFVFFLCCSVALVHQQAKFLGNNISANVIPLIGDGKDDLWKRVEWDRILVENKVVVCTAEILNQALSHNCMDMGRISLLIFDEGLCTLRDQEVGADKRSSSQRQQKPPLLTNHPRSLYPI